MDPTTKALRARADTRDARPAVTPLFLTSGFEAGSPYFYTRKSNPNVVELEQAVAALEGARFGLAVATGMAAISMVLELLEPGDAFAVGRDVYGCSFKLFQRVSRRRGLTLHALDLTREDLAIPGDTRLVLFETPTNPFLKTVDIARVAGAAHRANPEALVVVDNTWASPIFQHPLEHGADISLHSATKFLSGHGDVMGGVLLTNRAEIHEELADLRFYGGAILDAHSAWLLRRSLQTLPLRMREHQATTERIRRFLSARPEVARVHWPTVDGGQLRGYGGILCFELRAELADRYSSLAAALRLFDTGTAMACTTSKVAQPYTGSHASMTDDEKQAMGLDRALVRLCVGFEDPADLEVDLASAFAAVAAETPAPALK
jgi:cystathionine gamma-lyase/cystathionine gamma-lyase/homocysteine desulfhydrase